QLTVGPRFQLDHHATRVQAAAASATAAAAANLDLILRDVRILRDDIGHFQLVPRHLVEADPLDGLRADAEASLILAWQESFRHGLKQEPRADHQRDRDGHRDDVEAQAAA